MGGHETFYPSLRVTDHDGLVITATTSMELINTAPTVVLSAIPVYGHAPLRVTFEALASDIDANLSL